MSRTVLITSKKRCTARPGSYFRSLAAGDTAQRPLAPILPLGRDGCNTIRIKKDRKANMNKTTLALGYYARSSLRGFPRTLLIASDGWFTASARPELGPRATRGCALRPLPPCLPFTKGACNQVVKQSKCEQDSNCIYLNFEVTFWSHFSI